MKNRLIVVVGATAAGKSELALDLAQRYAGEVVNTDSMQVYRGMDIGTAKLPIADRRGIPHHLIDVAEVEEEASVAVFQRMAREVVEDCWSRGVAPVLVGGSALYTRAVVDNIEFPGTDPVVRRELEAELEAAGVEALYARLREVDPTAAAAIEPANGRRIVRALEVIQLTGGPFVATMPEPSYWFPGTIQIGVDAERVDLDRRIADRVDRMWADGFVDEVRRLEARLRHTRTASRAIGYQQVLRFLAGEIDEDQARTDVVTATRRFVRRQDAWFRKDPRVHWVRADDPDRLERIAAAVG